MVRPFQVERSNMSSLLQTLKQSVSPGGIEGYFAVKYAEWATNMEKMRNEYRKLAARVASAVQGERILEVGPGPGYVSIEIARLLPGIEIIGLDLSETMVEIATQNANEHGVSERVEFRQGNASQMPFEDSSFDFVVSGGSLHHWQEPRHVFKEIYRVLKPGCRALVSDLRRDAPQEAVKGWADAIDSWFMRWGLKHSFGESYTAQQIELVVQDTPFGSCEIKVREIDMDIWLRK
jgi:ubiquinone/menaquinone biosynthesis C-methylase UbiE